jgi:hypothetical protein
VAVCFVQDESRIVSLSLSLSLSRLLFFVLVGYVCDSLVVEVSRFGSRVWMWDDVSISYD